MGLIILFVFFILIIALRNKSPYKIWHQPLGIKIIFSIYGYSAGYTAGYILRSLIFNPNQFFANKTFSLINLVTSALLGILTTIGLWRLKEWGRKFAILNTIYAGFGLLYGFLKTYRKLDIVSLIIVSLIVFIVFRVIKYLGREEIKKIFS